MASKNKKQKQRKIPKGEAPDSKIPRQESTQGMVPHFSFEDLQGSYGIGKCENSEKIALLEKLGQLSKLTWQQIQHSGRHGTGCETIKSTSINPAIPGRLKNQRILAIRFDGTKPMVGYRLGRVFHLVWIDRNYTVYDHG